jgi:hypothetical protein
MVVVVSCHGLVTVVSCQLCCSLQLSLCLAVWCCHAMVVAWSCCCIIVVFLCQSPWSSAVVVISCGWLLLGRGYVVLVPHRVVVVILCLSELG